MYPPWPTGGLAHRSGSLNLCVRKKDKRRGKLGEGRKKKRGRGGKKERRTKEGRRKNRKKGRKDERKIISIKNRVAYPCLWES